MKKAQQAAPEPAGPDSTPKADEPYKPPSTTSADDVSWTEPVILTVLIVAVLMWFVVTGE